MAQMVKNLPEIQKIQDLSLGQEDVLDKEMVAHSSILSWRIPWIENPGGLQSMGSQRVGHNRETNAFPFSILIKCSKSESAENKHVRWEQDTTSLPASTLCSFNVSLEIPPSSVETELCHTQWIRAQHSNIDGPRDSCCCPVTKSCPTLCSPMDCNTIGFHVLHYISEFAQIHVHWVNDAIQASHHLLSLSSPALNLSQHQGLWECGSSHQVVKVLGLQSCNEYSGLISFRIDWFDPAVQETIKSILQNHCSKALILWCSVFLWSNSHYWKNHSFNYMDLHQQSNVSAFNMLSRFAIAFLPRSNHLLISWLQSPSTAILEPPK